MLPDGTPNVTSSWGTARLWCNALPVRHQSEFIKHGWKRQKIDRGYITVVESEKKLTFRVLTLHQSQKSPTKSTPVLTSKINWSFNSVWSRWKSNPDWKAQRYIRYLCTPVGHTFKQQWPQYSRRTHVETTVIKINLWNGGFCSGKG